MKTSAMESGIGDYIKINWMAGHGTNIRKIVDISGVDFSTRFKLHDGIEIFAVHCYHDAETIAKNLDARNERAEAVSRCA